MPGEEQAAATAVTRAARLPDVLAPVAIAVVALVRDGRVLLAHRTPARLAYPDCWDLVGGHIEPGESALRAARRECVEELGIEILDPTPIAVSAGDPAVERHAFTVTRWRGEPGNAAPDEHDALAWCTPREVAALHLADPVSWVPGVAHGVLGHALAGLRTREATAFAPDVNGTHTRGHD